MSQDEKNPVTEEPPLSQPGSGEIAEEAGPAAATTETPVAVDVAALQAELEKAQAQAAEYLEGWQRARAEFANYRRRVEAEREDIRCRSNEALLLKLLPIVDDFERALQVLPGELADHPWVDGVRMILNKIHALLESENVTAVSTVGQIFDPQWHEAMMQEETTEHPDGTIIEELRKGYRLGDRVLRPALVKVACNSAAQTSSGTNGEEESTTSS
ncbi:MAG: nucleotide exchange factor GrpE [Anaerolineae bacterium]